ncbi:fimbrial biogenesis chaperone [Nitrospira sp. NS4]|uniref:fimbrial biogenesis chaperone n=1 Tax=Nitrospira sp. NS4 TaxID=3414498 RepID=UPI003C3070A5
MYRPTGFTLAIVLVLCLFTVEEGRTSTFNVSPLKVVLSGKSNSALLEIANQSTDSLRLQLSVVAWDQSPSGEMLLTGTDDIVLFPPLLTVAPGEKRKIRLGAVTPRGTTEKTYRIVLEELPSLQTAPADGAQIRVLTRMTIPVFLQPSKIVVSGQIDGLTMRQKNAGFEIRNTGNTHFLAQHIQLTGLGEAGQPITTQDIEGWYILAGGSRRYDVPLSTEHCRGLKSLTVQAQTEAGPLKAQADVRTEECGR